MNRKRNKMLQNPYSFVCDGYVVGMNLELKKVMLKEK